MRLESKGAPNSQDRMIGNAFFLSHQATAPVGASPRCALQGLGEHLFDFLVVDAPRSSTARRVGKGLNLLPGITAAPLANRRQRELFRAGRSRY
jgi:hypothetical protein